MELEVVEFSDISIDAKSPRIPKSLQGSSMEELIPYFLFNEDLEPLAGSLSTLGWFPTEPLILQKMYDNTYTVIDGNRRIITCFLMLNVDNPVCPTFIKNVVNMMSESDKDRLKMLPAFIKN